MACVGALRTCGAPAPLTLGVRQHMRYHDYHLSKYEVSDRGETITFHLAYGYPGEETKQSCILFYDVALYNFVHTENSIITDIVELPISELLQEIGTDIVERNRKYRIRLWKDNLQNYSLLLQTEGYKAWSIESAVGFYGYIIAKAVSNA
jgi:hypothetical protein